MEMPLFLQEMFEDDTFEIAAILASGGVPESTFALGSRIGRSPNLKRDFASAHDRIIADYFADDPVYPAEVFERRFRMSREMFVRICDDMVRFDPKFGLLTDGLGRKGLSTIQKCTSSMRILAYGLPADTVDEYIKIGDSVKTLHAVMCSKSCPW